MSDTPRTILIVADDPVFSGHISELLLRAGVRAVRFASSRDALEVIRANAPNMVLLQMPREQLESGWNCYMTLRSETALSAIPILIYTPPCEQDRTVGSALEMPGHIYQTLAQLSLLLGGPAHQLRWNADEYVERFPTGRDDL